MAIRDGKANIRYLVMDMTHGDYKDTVDAFRSIHAMKAIAELIKAASDSEQDPFEMGTLPDVLTVVLTILPNNANTQAIVKVVGHVGWLEDKATMMSNGLTSGLMLNVYDYDDLPNIHALLASSDWPQEVD